MTKTEEAVSTQTKILLVEDDPDIVEVVRYNLGRDGYKIAVARNGEQGLQEATRNKPDLVLLDLMLPGLNGLEVCRKLRGQRATADVPVIMLTARSEESDVVVGLEMGADDYIAKPFSPRELVARVKAVLRRAERRGAEEGRTRVQIENLVLDTVRHEVLLDGKPVRLTRAEFRLLWALCQSPGRVFSRNDLAETVTAGENLIIDRNIDVHVSSIRKKLGDSGNLIATVRGVGYKCRG